MKKADPVSAFFYLALLYIRQFVGLPTPAIEKRFRDTNTSTRYPGSNSMARLSNVSYDDLSDEQQTLYNQIVKTRGIEPNGQIGDPFDAWLLNAEMGKRITGMGEFFRFRTSVDRRYIELTILVTGQFWQAQFEWYAHEPMGLKAGLPQEVIDAIKVGDTPPFEHEADRITFELCRELHGNH